MNPQSILRFRYENLRNEAHVEYNETCCGIILKYNPETLKIKSLFDEYKLLLDVEISVLDIIRKSEYTVEIAAQDKVRGETFRGFANAIKSGVNHFNADKRTAAKKIDIVLSHYGNMTTKPFDEESAAIDDLLRELRDNYSDDITVLSVSDWLSQLELENTRFKQLMSERYAEMAQRPTTRMKTARTKVDKALREMFNMIDALVVVEGNTNYETFIVEMNVVSERYKNKLAQSVGRRKVSVEK